MNNGKHIKYCPNILLDGLSTAGEVAASLAGLPEENQSVDLPNM